MINDLQELVRVDNFIDEFSRQYGLSRQISHNLNLILEEVLTNIISYGYADNKEHIIVLELRFVKDVIHVTVCDDGIAFNPLTIEPPALNEKIEDRRIGGLGIHIVKTITDDLSYQRIDDKNILNFAINKSKE